MDHSGTDRSARVVRAPAVRPKLEIVRHDPRYREAVEAFNARMRAGGSPWGFYASSVCDWLPEKAGRRVWREFYLAVEGDEQQAVRGAYALKPQPWWIRGREHVAADWQGPFSEGAVDARHGAVSLRLLRDMIRRQPLVYSWGHGGGDAPIVQMLRRLRWLHHTAPVCLFVNRPQRFLRRNGFLREHWQRRVMLDALAWSGLGSLGLRALHAALAVRGRWRAGARPAAEVDVFTRFEAWSDALWSQCRGAYQALAVRDADVMNTLLPRPGWPPVTRLRISHQGRTLGWSVVLDTQRPADPRFSELRLGTVVDCFGLPQDAPAIVQATRRYLQDQGVDLILANQSHPEWLRAFADDAFVLAPSNRTFVISPAFEKLLDPFDEVQRGLHLTNLDGHGPQGL